MQAGHAGTSGSDGVTDPQQDNGHLDEEPEEAVEWTRKMVRTHFTSQLSTTFSKEEVEEYIMMLAEITGKEQMGKDAPQLAEVMVDKWGYSQGEEFTRITMQELMDDGFNRSGKKGKSSRKGRWRRGTRKGKVICKDEFV